MIELKKGTTVYLGDSEYRGICPCCKNGIWQIVAREGVVVSVDDNLTTVDFGDWVWGIGISDPIPKTVFTSLLKTVNDIESTFTEIPPKLCPNCTTYIKEHYPDANH